MDGLGLFQELNHNETFTMKARDLEKEAPYLSPDFTQMEKNGEGKYIFSHQHKSDAYQKYFNRSSMAEEFSGKSTKYRQLATKTAKDEMLDTYSKTYTNHGSGKRKKKLKSAANYYDKAREKASDMESKLRNSSMEAGSKEHVQAQIDILQYRLSGMIDASKAKSYSDVDEELRINAARVKISSAMLEVYNRANDKKSYKKQIAALNSSISKNLDSYKKLLPKDAAEKNAIKLKNEQLQEQRNEESAQKQKKTVAPVEKKESSAAKQKNVPTSEYQLTNQELQTQIDAILSGNKLTFFPKHCRYKDQVITMEMYEEARKHVDLNRKIDVSADDMEAALSSNEEKDFVIVQTILARFKKVQFRKIEIPNAFKSPFARNPEEMLGNYVRETAICTAINTKLRTGQAAGGMKKVGDATAEPLKYSLQKTKLDYDIVVRRGVGLSTIGYMLNMEDPRSLDLNGMYSAVKEKTGEICTDKGLVSTSVLKKAGFHNDLELVILCHAGTQGLDISHGNGTKSDSEEELVIAPDTKFRIVDAKTENDKLKVYLETVVDNGDSGELRV